LELVKLILYLIYKYFACGGAMKKLLQLLIITILSAAAIIFPTNQAIDLATTQMAGAAPTIQQLSANTTQIWGNSGGLMMSVAAQVTASRNPPGQALSLIQKKYLRPHFGDLVDRAQINYGAKLLDRWSNGDREVHVGAVDSAAQAFCDRIYLRDSYRPQDTAQMVLVAHELAHFQQCLQLGDITRFGSSYFAAYQKADQNYANNPFEKAARVQEQKFIKNLCQRIDCEQPRGRYYLNYHGVNTKLPIKIN
jgi:Domain of unknown function (DUF4157)